LTALPVCRRIFWPYRNRHQSSGCYNSASKSPQPSRILIQSVTCIHVTGFVLYGTRGGNYSTDKTAAARLTGGRKAWLQRRTKLSALYSAPHQLMTVAAYSPPSAVSVMKMLTNRCRRRVYPTALRSGKTTTRCAVSGWTRPPPILPVFLRLTQKPLYVKGTFIVVIGRAPTPLANSNGHLNYLTAYVQTIQGKRRLQYLFRMFLSRIFMSRIFSRQILIKYKVSAV